LQENRSTMPHEIQPPAQSAFSVFISIIVGLFALIIILAVFRIEEHAFSVLLGDIGAAPLIPGLSYTLAQGLAAGLSGAKIVLPFIIVQLVATRGGWALRVNALRGLVLVLALLMTLVIVGNATISPNTQAVIDARVTEIDGGIETAQSMQSADLETAAKIITDRVAAEIDTVTTTAQSRLKELNDLLDAERQIGGADFKGPRYLELESLISTQIAARDKRIADLRAAETVDLNRIATDRANANAAFAKQRETAIAAIDSAAIAVSTEAQHPAIMTSLAIVKKFAPEGMADPVMVTIGLSILISLVFELLPMTLLGHVYRTFTVGQANGALSRNNTIQAAFRSNRGELHLVAKENSAGPTEFVQPADGTTSILAKTAAA